MKITESEGRDWCQWVLVTSIPLVQLNEHGTVVDVGAATMINHAGSRFILSVEHVVKRDSTGWAVVVQQDESGQMEYYRPNFFSYVGEIRRSVGALRMLDLCVAQVSSELQTWYEYWTPLGLFDKKPHQIFDANSIAQPDTEQIYAFSGQVRTEKHGPNVFASEMVVYPGLMYSHSEEDIHYFKLPVPHPGHDVFHGCSGSPIVDLNRNVVALVVGGDTSSNMVKGVAINRVFPNLQFLASRGDA